MVEKMGLLETADWLLLALIFLWVPLQELSQSRLVRQSIQQDVPQARQTTYLGAILQLWSLAGAVLLVWSLESRDWAELGFKFDGDRADIIVIAIAAAMIGYLLWQFCTVAFSARGRASFREVYDKQPNVTFFLPRSSLEYRRFSLLGITAGITEEIVFRGYLIGVLTLMMPLPLAALLSIVIFTQLHLYQGLSQLPMVAFLGTVLTLMFIFTGSLYAVIVLHILIDVIMGTISWIVMRSGHPQKTAEASI